MMRRWNNRVRFYRRRAQDGGPDDVTRELTILPDGTTFGAVSAEESAADDGPHPGLELAGEGAWEDVTDQSPEDFGLPYPVLAYQPDGTVRPAVEEFQQTVAAAEGGDEVAQQVLAYLACGGDGPPDVQVEA